MESEICEYCGAYRRGFDEEAMLSETFAFGHAEILDRISLAFGTEQVSIDERQGRIQSMFQSIAGRYDLMNDVMSGFLHRVWKRRLVRLIDPDVSGPIVDVAGGTGDVARLVARRMPGQAIVVLDPSSKMLEIARKRLGAASAYLTAKAECWPVEADQVGAITVSFGLRNFTKPSLALEEMYRVLKPGGKVYILEFSQPDPWIAPLYTRYSRLVIPVVGEIIAGNKEAYRYLVDSISAFPTPASVRSALTLAGFENGYFEKLLFGIAAIYVARKPL